MFSFSSLSMCGVPLAPLPWLSMWEMSLEEREDKETWERTKWTWENTDCESGKREDSGRRTGQWVGDMRHLPYIVTDHAGRVGEGRKDNIQKGGEKSDGDKAGRVRTVSEARDDCKDTYLVDAYSSLDIAKHCRDKHRQDIPIIVESSDSDDEDELDDYYENHKAWPTRSS